MNAMLAIERASREASFAESAEDALWVITRTLPSLFVGPAPVGVSAATPVETACVAFMLTPDKRFHMITAPVNFGPDQHHEKVAADLGHPAHVAKTRLPLLLRDTRHHQNFVKILQTFRAGSAMFAPMLWGEDYLGVIICACAIPGTFSESDLAVHRVFAVSATSLWVAKGGPEWMRTLDYDALPERRLGS